MVRVTLLVACLVAVSACSAGAGPDALAAEAIVLPESSDTGVASPDALTPAPITTTSTVAPPTTTSTSTTSTTSTSTTSTTSATTTTTTSTTTTTTLPAAPMTSCEQVIHIGDSTGVYLWEPQYVVAAENTMGERYRSVGARWVFPDNSGGRSIQERTADWQTTAFEVAVAAREGGFSGCWVLMIGTNDAAAIASGASMGAAERILRMLYVIGDDPVLWVDAVADGWVTGGYSNTSMQAWNDVLVWIASERPNVEVLRWSERVRTEWFLGDGIHYTSDGHAWRAAITALALAEAFPA